MAEITDLDLVGGEVGLKEKKNPKRFPNKVLLQKYPVATIFCVVSIVVNVVVV